MRRVRAAKHDVRCISYEAKKSTTPKAHASSKMVLDASSGARTLDTLIKSQVLYQLS